MGTKRISELLGTAAMLLFLVFSVSCTNEKISVVKVSLKSAEVSEKSGSQFVDVTADGEWTLSLVTEGESEEIDWVWLTTWGSEEESVAVTSSQALGKPVTIHYAKNNSTSVRTCRLVLTSGLEESACTLTQNRSSSEVIVSDELVSYPVPMWLELPATEENDGCFFIPHEMTLGSTYFRNFSLYMSEKDIVAHWVAYPLNPWTISSGVGRTNDWNLDPKIPRKNQPVLFRAFSGGTYARGHQIPSADRYADGANQQTFYGSNMTPQLHAFNSNIWAALEGNVRSKCRQFDTLYVVTGCSTKGSTTYCNDNDGKRIVVPSGYYKVLLGFKKSSSVSSASVAGGTGNYKGYYTAAAYYFDHKNYENTTQVINEHRMTVDQLEEIVEEDFFPNLEMILGKERAALVEQTNDKFWNL
ncbi:MAG: DNA/RNA non-specific endonuclease [Candidatus Cryptobacteroides sp.]